MTSRARSSAERPRRRAPARERPISIASDAVAYWLEDDEGYPVWYERPKPDAPLTLAARGFENGLNPHSLVLVARTSNGDRRVVATGWQLRAMADLFKPVRTAKEQASFKRFRMALIGPLDIMVDGAVEYWIERADGESCSESFERAHPVLLAAHEAITAGAPEGELVLAARLEDGSRYEVSRGSSLASLAAEAAGTPARPRRITAGPPYPTGTPRG